MPNTVSQLSFAVRVVVTESTALVQLAPALWRLRLI
jgi:hypothetical protein